MSAFRTATLLLWSASTWALAADEAAPPEWKFREVEVTVYGVDRNPAPGVNVEMLGLSRVHVRGNADPEKQNEGWSFVSDRHGKLTARLGQFDSLAHEKATGRFAPGRGSYYLERVRHIGGRGS